MSSPAAENTHKIPLPPARASSGMPASSMETNEAGAMLKIFAAPVSMENLSRSDKVYISKKEALLAYGLRKVSRVIYLNPIISYCNCLCFRVVAGIVTLKEISSPSDIVVATKTSVQARTAANQRGAEPNAARSYPQRGGEA